MVCFGTAALISLADVSNFLYKEQICFSFYSIPDPGASPFYFIKWLINCVLDPTLDQSWAKCITYSKMAQSRSL